MSRRNRPVLQSGYYECRIEIPTGCIRPASSPNRSACATNALESENPRKLIYNRYSQIPQNKQAPHTSAMAIDMDTSSQRGRRASTPRLAPTGDKDSDLDNRTPQGQLTSSNGTNRTTEEKEGQWRNVQKHPTDAGIVGQRPSPACPVLDSGGGQGARRAGRQAARALGARGQAGKLIS